MTGTISGALPPNISAADRETLRRLDEPLRLRAEIRLLAPEIVVLVTPEAVYDFRAERELGRIPQIILRK